MSLFKSRPSVPDLFDAVKSPVPIEHLDISKRYDLYCYFPHEERLYENVKIVAMRTLDDIPKRSRTVFGALVEIEAVDGMRIMLPRMHIHTVCEHGLQPAYKVLRSWPARGEPAKGEFGL